MPNESHQKISVAEAALDFGVSQAELNSLPAGDIAWCAPVTTLADEERAEVTLQITVGGTTPEGTVEVYIARDTGTLIVADHHIDLSDHGNEGTAADVADIISDCGGPVKVVGVNGTASIVHTFRFLVWFPGDSFNVLVFNNTDEAFASSGNDGYVRGWLPEVQD